MNNINDLLKDAFNSAPEKADSFQELKKANNEVPKKGASYFDQKQFYSRSDLLRIEKPDVKPYQPAFRMGSIIDAFLTEPEQFVVQHMNKLTEFEVLQLVRIRHAVKKAGILPDDYWLYHDNIIQGITDKKPKTVKLQHEYYVERFDVFGDGSAFIPFRIKTDIESGKTINDVKSTTKTTFLEFQRDIETHHLDMQAAVYSDVSKADAFKLTVVPYQNPQHAFKALRNNLKYIQQAVSLPDIWHHKFTQSQLDRGRDKYRMLAKKGIESGKIRTK